MNGIHWIELLVAGLFCAVCAMLGALVLMQRLQAVCIREREHGLPIRQAPVVGAAIGGAAGLAIGLLYAYYYLLAPPAGGIVEWTGRSSYALVIGASAGHLSILIHLWRRLAAELSDFGGGSSAQQATLTFLRRSELEDVRSSSERFADLKARDDERLEDLVSVFGNRLLAVQRSLGRIPFYGYLGTVCGILLMAQELTRLDEATETFLVLRDMAAGLVLAFQTTLAALVAYLPLRKMTDLLVTRMAELERHWLALRDAR